MILKNDRKYKCKGIYFKMPKLKLAGISNFKNFSKNFKMSKDNKNKL